MRGACFEWNAKRVLVTGATGMLGAATIALLRERNATICALSRSGGAMPGADEAIACDVTSASDMARHLGRAEADVVLHLAAHSQDTDEEPLSTFEVNVNGTLNVLEAVRSSGSSAAVIVASTFAVSSHWPFVDFAAGQRASRPYGASKVCAEVIARCYRDSFGLRLGVVRLSNLFGPRDVNLRRLVPGTICAALRGEPPVIRSDPDTLLNFLYVDEAAAAMLRFAGQVAGDASSEFAASVRNLEVLALRDMVGAILAEMNRPDLLPEMPVAESTQKERSQIPSAVPEDEWSLRPEIGLREGLRRTIDWYRHHYTTRLMGTREHGN
jgi:CDP-glucose 4,6-dehydratase